MPETWAINSTHDCYLFDFDTWDQVDNVSIAKGDANWTLLGYTPYANSTSEDDGYINLTGVIKGATYRVYVSVPTERLSEVYFAVYISSTGEGLPFETFRLRYCSGLTYNNTTAMDVVSPVIYLDYGENWTVAVLDYFGNEITNQSFVTNAALEYISIPVDVHSVKVYNQKEDFTKVRIYYNLSATPITYYAAPMEPVERFLRTGEYTFAVTFYDNHTAGSTVYFYLNVTDAEFLLIEGDTISRVITDIAGVYALERVITTMVTPDVVYIAACLPRVPGETPEEVVYIHPYAILTARVEEDYNGTSSALYLPYPSVAGTVTTVIEDYLQVNGNYSTEIWLNYTSNGTSYKHFANCPSYVPLDGGNYTLNSTDTIGAHRFTRFRQETLFYYAYYTSTKRYEVTLTANNSMVYADMNQVYWYVGFPENKSIDGASVRVYDLNNDLWLAPAVNYEVTGSGIRMYWTWLNASTYRSFKITFYDANASEVGLAIAYVEDYDSTTYDGESYYTCHASWTNSFAGQYVGQLVVRLNFDEAEYIDSGSLVIIDKITSRELGADEFAYAGTSIMINQVSVGVGQIYSFDVYFLLDYEKADEFDWFAPVLEIAGIPISAFAFIALGWGVVLAWTIAAYSPTKLTITLVYGSIIGVLYLLNTLGYV